MLHNHKHGNGDRRGLILSIFLNSFIVIAEFIGGIISGSMALLGDATHNLSDVIALILSYLGEIFSEKKGDKNHTFDFKRAEVIIAFVNSLALIIIGIYIIYESIIRYYLNHIEVNSIIMLSVGFIGLLGNVISIIFLHKEKDDNLNKKSAYLHLFFDAVSSVMVVLSGILIYYTNLYIVDLITSIIISILVIKSGLGVLKSSLHILMQGVPENINIEEINFILKNINGIIEIHNLHIWNIDSNEIFLSAHILVDNIIIKEDIINNIKDILDKKWHIHNTSLQLVSTACCTK